MDEAQAGIKIAGRNINNLRYAEDTIIMAESDEEYMKKFILTFTLRIGFCFLFFFFSCITEKQARGEKIQLVSAIIFNIILFWTSF